MSTRYKHVGTSRQGQSAAYAVCLAVALGAIGWLVADRSHVLPSTSVDMAHHYNLIQELMDYGQRTEYRPYLGVMNVYPPMIHYIIAKIATFFSAPIYAIAFFCISTYVAILVLLNLILARQRISLALSAIFSFAVFSISTLGLRMFSGYEIKYNFFLSQFGGELLFLVSILLIIAKTREASWARYISVFACTTIVSAAHLVPGLRLLSFFVVLGVLTFVRRLFDNGIGNWRTHVRPLIFDAVAYAMQAVLIVQLHPAYATIRGMAHREGALDFALPYPVLGPAAIILLFIVFGVTAISLRYRRGDPVLFTFCCALVVSAGGLLIAQFGLKEIWGLGSSYAVKKHVFMTWTFALLFSAVAFAAWTEGFVDRIHGALRVRWSRSSSAKRTAFLTTPFGPSGWKPLAAVVASIVIASVNYPVNSHFSLAHLVRAQAVARELGKNGLFLPLLYGLPNVMNFLISVADMHWPHGERSDQILFGRGARLLEEARAGRLAIDGVLTDSLPRVLDPDGTLPPFPVFVIGERSSWADASTPTVAELPPDGRIGFKGNARAAPYLGRGWHPIERSGVYSRERRAEILFRVAPSDRMINVSLMLRPFLFRGSQSLTVTINGGDATLATFTDRRPRVITVVGEPTAVGVVKISLNVSHPSSPLAMGLNRDPRQHGVQLISLAVER